jgi:hypothetical protein
MRDGWMDEMDEWMVVGQENTFSFGFSGPYNYGAPILRT